MDTYQSANKPREETLLLYGFFSVLLVYAYFFVFDQQHWMLRDDFGNAILATEAIKEDRLWKTISDYIVSMASVGRANYLDQISRYFVYSTLPITPRAFHIFCILRSMTALLFFWLVLRRLSLSKEAAYLGVFLVVSSLSYKEGLAALSVSEGLAVVFLFASLFFFYSKNPKTRWLSLLTYALCLFSKESFFVTFSSFACIGAYRYLKTKKIDFVSLGLIAIALAFLVYVKSLPKIYASGFSFSKISSIALIKSLVFPPAKSFAPLFALFTVIFFSRPNFSFSERKRELLIWGSTLVFASTVFLNAWGPFDSWFYLHLAIPYGWGIVAAILFECRSGKNKNWVFASLVLLVGYGLVATINGSRNYTRFFANSKTVAEMSCELLHQNSQIKIYTNCEEGASQMRRYLAYEKRCAVPPNFKYIPGDVLKNGGADLTGPALYLFNAGCDIVDLSRFNPRTSIELKPWVLHLKD